MASRRRAILPGGPGVIRSSIVRFALVGGVNTAVGYLVILLLHYRLQLDLIVSNAIGYLVGGVVSYVLNRNFTFSSKRSHLEAAPRFWLTAACCFGLNLLVLEMLLSAGMHVAMAQAMAVGAYSVAFYLGSRHLVFRT